MGLTPHCAVYLQYLGLFNGVSGAAEQNYSSNYQCTQNAADFITVTGARQPFRTSFIQTRYMTYLLVKNK